MLRRCVLLAFTLIAFTAPALAGQGKFNKAVSPGDKAPTFAGIPAVIGDNETTLSLADIKEDVVVVVFLANHCPFVTQVEDRLIDLVNDTSSRSVKFVGLCCTPSPGDTSRFNQDYAVQDTFDKIKERVAQKGYNFVYGRDDSQKSGKAYGAEVTPVVFVLDKTRTIRYQGAIDDNINEESKVQRQYLRDAIESVLAGKPVKTPETQATGCPIHYEK
jgi:peroxiredoxin